MTRLTNAQKQQRFRDANRELVRARDRDRYARSPRRWETHLKRNYGLSREDYDAMHTRQGGRCAICREEDGRRLHVDHCHSTGSVRGLLCQACNRLLGQARDRVEVLRRAATYLKRSLPRSRRRSSKRTSTSEAPRE